jgi:hypothetical protein
MDDFLYIILGIAWLAYSLYTNKQKLDKKRAEREAQLRGGTPENHDMEDDYQRTEDEYRRAEDEYRRAVDEPKRKVETHQESTHRRPEEEYVPLPKKTLFDELFGDQTSPYEEAQEETYIPEVNEQTWQKKMMEYAGTEAASMEEIKDEVPPDYFTRQYEEVYKSVDQRVVNKMQDYDDYNEIQEVQEEFDLKKAVIYSTILRAPYVSDEV